MPATPPPHAPRLRAALLTAATTLLLGTPCLADLRIQFRSSDKPLVLETRDARQQLLATGDHDRDLTREVLWSSEPAGIVAIDATGRVSPVADGKAVIKARLKDQDSADATASLPVTVTRAEESAPIHFSNQIVPVFTKTGCNGGGCHGKAAGQNGFKLSLLGFEPSEDYEHLVKEARGRRLFPAAPERSLLLTKGAAQVPHGGGKRIDPDSDDYRLLLRWIAQGMPLGRSDAPTVSHIEVFPTQRTLAMNREQQLVVTAHYSDGSTEDVTRSALFEANDKDIAAIEGEGRVKIFNLTGEVAVMVRYQGKVATFRGTIPLGAPVDHLPPARNFVDEHIFRDLKRVGMPPSEPCDDPTFLRRVTLDIAGRLPTPAELTAFLADAANARQPARDAAIERLLASGDYADFFANKWSSLLRNKRSDAKQQRGTYAFHGWIRDSLNANRPYNEWVRDLLTASGDLAENPPVAWYRQVRTMQGQLEDLSQLFLGQRMQCAQCHHHPYEKWSQNDYWSFGAFFSQVSYKPGSQLGEESVVHRRGQAQATNKKTGQPLKPAGLAAKTPAIGSDEDPRLFLADWMTSSSNPWFARALVNRYWKHFFGRGLVDPEDDMRETNPATNPELLEALASHFVKNDFDLKNLVRTLTTSTTYQLSAEPNEHNARDRHHFARFQPRRLGAEVLLDAVNTLTLAESTFDGLPKGTRAVCLPDNSFNAANYFLTVFGRPESSSACECERSMDASLSQSLHLLNSKDIQAKLSADSSRAARLAGDEKRADPDRLRELYRLAFSRDPRPEEIALATDYLTKRIASVKEGKDAKETEANRTKARREAWEDTVWALLNTKEFLFNH
jgi:hypothetical protein